MKKFREGNWKVWFLMLAAVMVLSACSGDDKDSSAAGSSAEQSTAKSGSDGAGTAGTESGSSADANSSGDSSGSLAGADDEAPAEGMVRSLLTNEWVEEEVASTRPIAVMIPNESSALPQYSIASASILYEAPVEGRMTRLLAVYEDWEDLEKIGNIRSLRTYYGYWAMEWDAFIIHIGGPYFVDEVLSKAYVQDVEEVSPAMYRDSSRKAPHNAYATGAGILSVIQSYGYSLSYQGVTDDTHFQFTTRSDPNTLAQYSDAQTATEIDMTGCYPLTRCYFIYNEEDGLYYRYQHVSGSTDGPHVDGATGEQLTFTNILVQYMAYEDLGEGYLSFQVQDSGKDGWYFTQGKAIKITWEKTSDFGATRYYDSDGNEITLNTGKTMIMIVKDDEDFNFE